MYKRSALNGHLFGKDPQLLFIQFGQQRFQFKQTILQRVELFANIVHLFGNVRRGDFGVCVAMEQKTGISLSGHYK
ncbi:hypothetical protein [Effusibacillus consociatus]|uniref:hypothetical protein n=1 Tax=Effusibacillus consociatus TaxID=1117041 RepID=UPI0036D35F3F